MTAIECWNCGAAAEFEGRPTLPVCAGCGVGLSRLFQEPRKGKRQMAKEDLKKKSRAKFMAEAKPFQVQIEGSNVIFTPKQFSTGSVGFSSSGKILVQGETLQASINLVVVNSKEWGD